MFTLKLRGAVFGWDDVESLYLDRKSVSRGKTIGSLITHVVLSEAGIQMSLPKELAHRLPGFSGSAWQEKAHKH
jgi:hypothetical protein